MTKKSEDTILKKVLPFLQDLKDKCEHQIKFSLSGLAKEYGIPLAGYASTSLIKNGWVKQLEIRGKYAYISRLPLDRSAATTFMEDTERLSSEYYANKLEKSLKDSSEKVLHRKPITHSVMSPFTDKAIIAELKRRGYTGNLEKTNTVSL